MTTLPTLLIADGNSLLHRAFHARKATGLHTRDGRPSWAVHGFVAQLLAGVQRAGADGVVVGFDDPEKNYRKLQHPDYKATRSEKPQELVDQLTFVEELLREAGVAVMVAQGWEADDVLASVSAATAKQGWRAVLMTSDRDAFALIDEQVHLLRVINGGVDASPILTPERLETLVGVGPEDYLEYAAVRGDVSDNLPGIKGVGKVTAAKLLQNFDTMADAFADVDNGGEKVTQVAGKAAVKRLACEAGRASFALNVELMGMQKSLPLTFALKDTLFPINSADVAAALDRFELHSLQAQAQRVWAGVQPRQEVPQPPSEWDDIPWPTSEPHVSVPGGPNHNDGRPVSVGDEAPLLGEAESKGARPRVPILF